MTTPGDFGKFDEPLSHMYEHAVQADYYSIFLDSIFHCFHPLEIEDKDYLDLGCGNGRLCYEFVRKGIMSATGLDISHDQISKAKKYFNSSYYNFQVQNIYLPFDLKKKYDIVSCIYALHFTREYNVLMQACKNIYNHVRKCGIAIVLDITHDYQYDRSLMKQLKELTMYEYLPNIPEGEIPKTWQTVKCLIHTTGGVLQLDHIAIHGVNLVKGLKEAGFKSVERRPLIHANDAYVRLWGPQGFNHHLLVCRKEH